MLFHIHHNSIDNHIQFTREYESDGCITFLNTKTIKNEDDSITNKVHRKETHTDKYLNSNSLHTSQNKCSAAKTLLDRYYKYDAT